MNRLIIIGNGFDLAHNHPTKYSQFLESWLWKKLDSIRSIKGGSELRSSMKFEDDPFAKFSLDSAGGKVLPESRLLSKFDFFLSHNKINESKMKELVNRSSDVIKMLDDSQNAFLHINFKGLVRTLIEYDPDNWATIESIYYDQLKVARDVGQIQKLNDQLLQFQKSFVKYLIGLSFDKKIGLPLLDKFRIDSLTDNDIVEVMILSFNYTKIIDLYRDQLQSGREFMDIQLVKIHGDIYDMEHNPIIFGYGDEHDENYKKIELSESSASLEFIKSMKYFLSDNYKRLIKFLKDRPFEVFVIGHSCGLTDKTLLKFIFEDQKPQLIYPFYHHDEKQYFENVKAISRHFKDKVLLRETVVNLDPNTREMLLLP